MTLQQQQQQPEQTPPVIPDTEAPPQPVDVDIDGGKAEEVAPDAPPPAAPPEPPQQRTKPRPQQRIQTLTHERDQWQTAAQRLENELAQARREAAEARAAREQAERSGMENLVARTKSEVNAATVALRAAKEAGDANAEVEAQKRLARAVAEEADADAWSAANPKQEPQQQQQQQRQQSQQQQQQPQPVQALSGPVRDFMAENPWFSVVEIGQDGRPLMDHASGRPISNASFDPELHDIAMLEHRKIEREVRLGKLQRDFIESPEYFERIKTRVMTEAPDAFEAEAEDAEPPPPQRRTPPMKETKQNVAPSNRQVPTQAPQRQGTKMRLDGEQAALVRSLVDNGTMLYPRNHPDQNKAGRKMSYEDAYVKYAREIANNPPTNQQ